MVQALCSAKLGLHAQQTRLDTIANNIANINTGGFCSSSVAFSDAMYAALRNGTQRGSGVIVAATSMSFGQGAPINTGNPMDFIIDGAGFFAVERSDGTTGYTRAGNFAVSLEQDGNYLVTAEGAYVLDENGQRIGIPDGTNDIAVEPDGTLRTSQGTAFARLGVVGFANRDGLSRVGNNCFVETVASGPAQSAVGYTVKNGVLEGSNVDLAQQMGELIRAQRAYSIAGKALQTADEMRRIANNLRA